MKKIVLTRNFILTVSVIIMSCSGGQKKAKATKQENDGDWSTGTKTEKVGNTNTNATISANAINIKKANGDVLGSINSAGPFSFTCEGNAYTSQISGDKRKYKSNNGVIEVKYKEDGFKVRGADGKLIWKVKITDDKIKISDNEEGKNPWELKISENGKAKIKKDDKEIGKVKFDPAKKEVEVPGFAINADKLSLAYCVLLIDAMPVRDKLLIMTEIIAKGR